MKAKTAINNAMKIAERIKLLNGLIGTPGTGFECFRIKRAWVIGSTIKGKENPNDLDIILDAEECGRRFNTVKLYRKCSKWPHYYGAKLHKEYLRRYGMYSPVSCEYEAHKYLRGWLKMARIHDWKIDHEAASQRIMIYPRNDLISYARDRHLI